MTIASLSSSFDDSSTEDVCSGVRSYLFDPKNDSDKELPTTRSPDHDENHSERIENNEVHNDFPPVYILPAVLRKTYYAYRQQ